MDGDDLLVLEFLALVICVTVLIVISGKFKPLVIITSAYPNLGLTVLAIGHLKGLIHSSVLELK
jgi:hypothetical protein